MSDKAERERIRAVYARRCVQVDPKRYSLFDAYVLHAVQERERVLLMLLKEEGITSLEGMRVLDVGCGQGALLRQFLEYGAVPGRLVGIDLVERQLRNGHETNPATPLVCSDAAAMPFGDSTFDLVIQSTVFTSVLDNCHRHVIAKEMVRVLRPSGRIVWYDFIYDNPRNPDVAGVAKKKILALFPGWRFRFRRITLAPPFGRALPSWELLYRVLSSIRLFSSHYLCLGKRL